MLTHVHTHILRVQIKNTHIHTHSDIFEHAYHFRTHKYSPHRQDLNAFIVFTFVCQTTGYQVLG